MSHLSGEDFCDLWEDRLEPDRMRRVVRHLMSGCAACCQRLLRDAPEALPFFPREGPPADAYDAAIDRAVRKVHKLLPRWERERETRDKALAGLALGSRKWHARGVWAHCRDASGLAETLVRTCQAKGVNPAALHALQTFELLCHLKAVTVPHTERIRGFLGQLQHSPRLRFDPAQVLAG